MDLRDVDLYVREGRYSPNVADTAKRTIRRKSKAFFISPDGKLMYRSEREGVKDATCTGTGRATSRPSPREVVFTKEEQERIMANLHGGVGGGHFGRNRTREKVQSRYYWQLMTRDIDQYVRECEVCQRAAVGRTKGRSSLYATPASEIWDQPPKKKMAGKKHDWSKKREAAKAKIDKSAAELNDISQEIWSHPELAFEEHHAHSILTDFLEKEGFEVTRNYHLDTAFKATFGSDDGVHVCVMCEYDALPNIGHACGHNLIAECGAGAGLGIKAALSLDDKPVGRVTVLGTPAEEGGGGKKKLIEAGALKGMDVAMMAHPFADNVKKPFLLSLQEISITFTGHAAHAAAAPWKGVNALDAAVMCYSSISVMRQQFQPDWRVHGIITNGGAQPNIIPEEAALAYYLRAPNEEELAVIREKVEGCAKGAAMQTGCEVAIKDISSFANVVTNPTLVSVYEKYATGLGVEFVDSRASGSTDMGNVSYVVPSIHPLYGIGTREPNHSRAFTKATGAPEAQAPTLVQAKAMALTALELLQPGNAQLVEKIKKDFSAQMAGSK